jgi:hypothetical protein
VAILLRLRSQNCSQEIFAPSSAICAHRREANAT